MVDTAATARACVELLRERNLGVATCLILESQERLQTQAPSKPPEGAFIDGALVSKRRVPGTVLTVVCREVQVGC